MNNARNYQLKTLIAIVSLIFIICLPLKLHSQERFRRTPPYPEPLSPMKIPPVETAILNNGLKVITITRLNSPLFCLQILIHSGESDSPPELSGLATITAQMLTKGTLTLNSAEIEEQIESLGIDFSIEVQSDYMLFSFLFLPENLEQVLDLIKSFFIEPAFPSLELISVKRELYYQLLSRKKDPENAGYEFFLKKVFASTGYNPGVIDEEQIKNISQKDLISFHQKFIRPNNSIIILNGNINLNNAARIVSQRFGRWVLRPIDRASVPFLENKNFNNICFLDLPSKDLSVIVGNVISPMAGEDYFPLLVLNQILGGSTTSRLFLSLRESKGLAYYAFTDLSFFRNNGLLWVRVRTSPEAVSQVVKEVQGQFKSLAEENINPQELELAKAYLVGNFPLQNQFPDQLGKKIGLSGLFQLPPNFWNKYSENIMLVNLEKIKEVARKYFSHQPLVVISGDLNSTLDYLKDFEKIEIYNRKGQFIATYQKGVLKYENR